MAVIQLIGGRETNVDDADRARLEGRPWRIDANGYAIHKTGEELTYMHRVIAGAAKGQIVDHINGDRLDNRSANLRICTHAENMRNRKTSKSNKLGLKGVWLVKHKNRYASEIKAGGKRFRLGYFDTAEDAHAAYVVAAKLHHGAFANVGKSG